MHKGRTYELFNDVYTVLVTFAGAHENWRPDFIQKMLEWTHRDPYQTQEFRFGGSLGMGGKFWLTGESFHVSAYIEDTNERRREAINKTNEELKKLFVPPGLVTLTGRTPQSLKDDEK